jgi:hypothetical protein
MGFYLLVSVILPFGVNGEWLSETVKASAFAVREYPT